MPSGFCLFKLVPAIHDGFTDITDLRSFVPHWTKRPEEKYLDSKKKLKEKFSKKKRIHLVHPSGRKILSLNSDDPPLNLCQTLIGFKFKGAPKHAASNDIAHGLRNSAGRRSCNGKAAAPDTAYPTVGDVAPRANTVPQRVCDARRLPKSHSKGVAVKVGVDVHSCVFS